MLIPSISHGMGLIVLFGRNGLLTNILGWDGTIYGQIGIIAGGFLYSFPVAFLLLLDVLKYEDGSVYEAADILGVAKWRQIKDITLPYLYKPLVTVFFAVFTMVITDYGVPLVVGGKVITLPVLMYQEVAGLLHFDKGAVIAFVLLVPAVVAFIIDLLINTDKINGSIQPVAIRKNEILDKIAYISMIIFSICLLLPIVIFIPLSFMQRYPFDLSITFTHIENTFNMHGGMYLLNSLVMAVIVAVVGTVLATASAYITARVKGCGAVVLHFLTISTLAVPGIVLGLGYILLFKGSFIYGTLAILIMVNIVHFFASPYLMMYNAFGKLNSELENISMTLGIGRWYIIKDVLLPQVKGTLTEMFAYYFVNCMMTISAVTFLANTSNKPIALLIPQFEGQMMLESAAFISVIILIVNILMKVLMNLAKADKGAKKC